MQVGNSDHRPVLCCLHAKLPSSSTSVPRRIWCYERADFVKLNSVLIKADWSAVLGASDVDSAWLACFLDSVLEHVPSKMIKIFKPKLPWMTGAIEKEIKLKHSLFS